jgi:hypothetical protein
MEPKEVEKKPIATARAAAAGDDESIEKTSGGASRSRFFLVPIAGV